MNSKQEKIIQQTELFVKKTLEDAEGGHDWWHIERVRKSAIVIGKAEDADLFIVELGALLHDIADAKFHNGDEEIGPYIARNFLQSIDIEESTIDHIVRIIENISFSKSFEATSFNSIELKVIQDADRLDAMGAIGIARAFNYGGYKNREIYNPDLKPNTNLTKSEYKSSKSPTLNHFYEKLLLLKDKMNTNAGRKMAENRHDFMLQFLSQFYAEWNSEN